MLNEELNHTSSNALSDLRAAKKRVSVNDNYYAFNKTLGKAPIGHHNFSLNTDSEEELKNKPFLTQD
jgi:hypothetical protein